MQILTYEIARDGAYVAQQLKDAYPAATFTVQTGVNLVAVTAPDSVPASSINAIVQAAIVPEFRGRPVRNSDELDVALDEEILAAAGQSKERLAEQATEIMVTLSLLFPTDGISEIGDQARAAAQSQLATLAPFYGTIAEIRAEAAAFRAAQGW